MLLEGMQLGRYRLVRLLGSGGMGEVYLAEDSRINRQVAIKVVRAEMGAYPDTGATKEASRLFEREIKAISALDHPHILPLYDYGEETIAGSFFTYMVMPYRQENSLATWLKRGGKSVLLSPLEVADVIQQAASALQYAHDRQIIHQDVKPSNFLIRVNQDSPNRPELMLADFGVAKFSAATSSMSHSIRGTPTYMAPEQWYGEAVPATDQYALAIMAYELLTGRPPFQGSPMRMMYMHSNLQPERPSSLNPHIPKDLDDVILTALAKNSQERFASITAFANAFQQAANSVDAPTFININVQPAILKPPPSSASQPGIPSSNDGYFARTTPAFDQRPQFNMANPTPVLDGRTPVNMANPTPISLPGEIQAPPRPQSPLKGKAILLGALALLIIAASAGFFYLYANNHAPTANTRSTATSQNGTGLASPGSTPTINTSATSTAFAIANVSPATNSGASSTATAVSQANATATANAQANATATADANATAAANATATANAQANATATANAQANATATATANPYPPFTSTGMLVLNDALVSNDSNNWDSNSSCSFTGGSYHVTQATHVYSVDCFAHNTSYSNFAYQVQITIISGDCGAILLRANGGNFYAFYICSYGAYYLFLYGSSNSTLASGNSSAINTGLNQTNLIAVVANGSNIGLYVNKQLVTTVADSTYSQGAIGVAAASFNNPTEVAFSNVMVWA